MGSIFTRGRKLYVKYRDASGKWVMRATPFAPGDLKKAQKLLVDTQKRIQAGQEVTGSGGTPTVAQYSQRWAVARKTRGITIADDEEARLKKFVLPRIGHLPLSPEGVRPRHIREVVAALRVAPTDRDSKKTLAPRTIRAIFMTTHKMFADAVIDELIDINPCQLPRGELPKKIDHDPVWRSGAIFTRFEIEQITTDPRIPEDRRMLYALLFFLGVRFGEGAAATWGRYDPDLRPLGRILVSHSWSTTRGELKGTKTESPRAVPVHPRLAAMLEDWKAHGWADMIGRQPKPEDLIVPSREGRFRNVNHGLKRFHEDLDRLGLRRRRQHDLRRSFISLCVEDGARREILHWITHGADGTITDLYTTLSWGALCGEVQKLQIPCKPTPAPTSNGDATNGKPRELAESSLGAMVQPVASHAHSCISHALPSALNYAEPINSVNSCTNTHSHCELFKSRPPRKTPLEKSRGVSLI
jgi:integrase